MFVHHTLQKQALNIMKLYLCSMYIDFSQLTVNYNSQKEMNTRDFNLFYLFVFISSILATNQAISASSFGVSRLMRSEISFLLNTSPVQTLS